MASVRGVFLLLILIAIIILGGMAAADQALIGSGTNTTTITNESFTPDGGNYTNFSKSLQNHTEYSSNVTVYDANVTEVSQSGNYEWETENGTLFIESNSYLDNQSTGFIDYTFTEPNNQSKNMFLVYNKGLADADWLMYILIGGVFIMFMKVLGEYS